MKNFFKNVSCSFLPSAARKELFLFLSCRCFKNEIIQDLTLNNLRAIHAATGIQKEPDINEIKDYILKNHVYLEERSNKILQDFVRRAIPGFDWLVILKNIALFSLFCIPAISYLLYDIVYQYNNRQPFNGAEVFALALLILLIFIVGTGLIVASFLSRKG